MPEKKADKTHTPLSSQNISVLEVGANARAFDHFLEFFKNCVQVILYEVIVHADVPFFAAAIRRMPAGQGGLI